MKFEQNNPLVDYRENLILAAAIEIDRLQTLRSSSSSLSEVLAPLGDQEALIRLLNEFAYHAINQLVPDVIAKVVEQELIEMPITLAELEAVLARPISSALKVLQRKRP
jgi:hypothetical protein